MLLVIDKEISASELSEMDELSVLSLSRLSDHCGFFVSSVMDSAGSSGLVGERLFDRRLF